MVTQQTQFSLFLINKPGILASILNALASAQVNLLAVTLIDSQEHGVLRLVAQDPAKARLTLESLNLPLTETDVLCLELDNRPGALASATSTLGDHHVNINYAYCTTTPSSPTRTLAILKVADPTKATKLLTQTT
jgi:hypothetical protein